MPGRHLSPRTARRFGFRQREARLYEPMQCTSYTPELVNTCCTGDREPDAGSNPALGSSTAQMKPRSADVRGCRGVSDVVIEGDDLGIELERRAALLVRAPA